MACCTCGVKQYKECWNCGSCMNDECECTQQDYTISEMQQDIINLRETCQTLRNRIDILEGGQ